LRVGSQAIFLCLLALGAGGTTTDIGNTLSGDNTTTTTESAASTIQEHGTDAGSNNFTLTKSATDSSAQTVTANDFTGSYSSSVSDSNTTTNQESNTNSASNATFTETITDISNTHDNGNSLTGSDTTTTTGTTTSTDSDNYSDSAGLVSVTESSSETHTTTDTANTISGDDTITGSASNSYSMTETASTFTLTVTGSLTETNHETGNAVDGTYTSTTTPTDSYSMTETGATTGGTFTETVTGTDTATTTETGNSDAQTLSRTIIVGGSYTRTDTGPGATLGSGSGSIGGTVNETADSRSGIFGDTTTGTNRYSLLEKFTNVANTQSNTSPGNMEFQPVGEAFQDGHPAYEARHGIRQNQTPDQRLENNGAAFRLGHGLGGNTLFDATINRLDGRTEQQRRQAARNMGPSADQALAGMGGAVNDGMREAGNFSAGVGDAVSLGLTRRLRQQWGYNDVVNENSAEYGYGSMVGTAISVAMSFGNPCAMGSVFQAGFRAVQAVQAVGGALNAADKFKQDDLWGGLLDLAGVAGNLSLLSRACFSGDTELMARGKWGCGWRRIDAITLDDEVLSRPEGNPNGPLEWKRVEELFQRQGFMIHLHIGGQVIRTTREHPFYVFNKGWVPASELQAGDLLSSHDGRWTPIEEVYDTGDYETVYNLRVADWHTYFVGGEDWGFSVWAHNAYDLKLLAKAKSAYPKLANITQLHHVIPKYLGGAANGRVVALNAAYHQLITNQFRSLWAYGQARPSARQLAEMVAAVYKKIPI